MKGTQQSNSSKPLMFYVVLTLLFLLTAVYSYFLQFSTWAIHALITESNTNPSLLFSVMVKPYLFWIVAAWVLFGINTKLIFKSFNNSSVEGTWWGPLIQMLWILTAFLIHLVALFSPFVSQGYVMQ